MNADSRGPVYLGFVAELEDIAHRSDAAGFNLLSNALLVIIRCAYSQFSRSQTTRLLTIAHTAIELARGDIQ